jgi:PD-(D/E)XK nuclease superfamily
MGCPRKWYYRYVLRLQRKAYLNPHLVYGMLVHFWLEWLYRNQHQGTTENDIASEVPAVDLSPYILDTAAREEIELMIHKAWIAFKAYRLHYRQLDSHLFIISNEETYTVTFRGFTLSGKIDMIARPNIRDGIFIWDFKTAGRLDATILDAWSFRFQFLFYCWLYWRATGKKPDGTIVNGLVKCQLRPKLLDRKEKTRESREQYLERVTYDMRTNREKYFYRQRMPLGTGQLEWFESEVLIPNLQPFSQMRRWLKLDPPREFDLTSVALSMNTGQCHMYNSICEYLPLCKDGPMMLNQYFRQEVKHPELDELEQVEEP